MHEGKAKALNGGYKHVFLWQSGATGGDSPPVTYREVKDVFREEVARGWTVAMGAADLDGDLLPEIYFAHDFGPDRLLHNRSTPGHLEFAVLEGRRDFTTPKSCVLGHDSFKGMGCDFGDVNGDGLLDIYVSNIATKFGLTESHFLWQSTGQSGGNEARRRSLFPEQRKAWALAQRFCLGLRVWLISTMTACWKRCRRAGSSKAKSIAGPNCRRSARATTRSSTIRASGRASDRARI